jgi:hypothetical protein
MMKRNALLRGEALTALLAGGILALAPALDPGAVAIALAILAIDAALRSHPAFSESVMRDLSNPWQEPAGIEATTGRAKGTDRRGISERRSSDPAPATAGSPR